MPSQYLSNYGVVEVTAATLAITAAGYAGQTIVSNLAATQTFTLPAATGSGNIYRILIKTTKTGNMIIKVANATDVIQGTLAVSTDASGVVIPTASTTDTITMSGSTTGGVAGSQVVLQDVAAGLWAVSGGLVSTGVEATPFSATVS